MYYLLAQVIRHGYKCPLLLSYFTILSIIFATIRIQEFVFHWQLLFLFLYLVVLTFNLKMCLFTDPHKYWASTLLWTCTPRRQCGFTQVSLILLNVFILANQSLIYLASFKTVTHIHNYKGVHLNRLLRKFLFFCCEETTIKQRGH